MGRSPKKDVLGQLRMIVRDMYEDNIVLDNPKGNIIKFKPENGRLELLKAITELVMCTSYSNEESKMFLKNPYITYKGICEESLIQNGKMLNESTVNAKINYLKTKFIKSFGDDMLLKLLVYREDDITSYTTKVNNEIYRCSKTNILEEIVLPFGEESEFCDSVTDEEFNMILDVMLPYSKNYMKKVMDNIDSKYVGYIKYISSRNVLDAVDEERLMQLKNLIL